MGIEPTTSGLDLPLLLPRSSVGRVTVDLIRRSWVRFPPRSIDFFFISCGSLIPFTRANAQWVIHGFNQHLNLHFRVNSLFHHLYFEKSLLLSGLFFGSMFLEIAMSTFSGCADLLPDCASIAANDKDSCKNREMKENCPESCNLCGKSEVLQQNGYLNAVTFQWQISKAVAW